MPNGLAETPEGDKVAFGSRYLEVKRPIDDRALHHGVWQAFVRELPSAPCKLLEIGAGIGTMAERLIERRVVPPGTTYTAVDDDAVLLQVAGRRLARPDAELQFEPCDDDFYHFAQQQKGKRHWDRILAHAFLDLVDLRRALPALFALLAPQGRFYFTINFDGLTVIEPTIEPKFDALIMALYHRSMDERRVAGQAAGHSRTGRQLFSAIPAAGGQILAAGSSDWVIFPSPNGYSPEESRFLGYFLDMIERSLSGHPELETRRFVAWVDKRRSQVANGEMVLVTHQLDFYGRLSTPGP